MSNNDPLVEILYFDGCPNHHPAIALVERISRELDIEPDVRLVNVPDEDAARRLRFLGSPTIRISGVDVDPHTEERDDYALSCRVFRTDAGVSGQPDERWVRDALLRDAGDTRRAGPRSMNVEHLFDAELHYQSGMRPIATEGDGQLIGSGDGVVHGAKLDGSLRWTLFEEPGTLVCSMNPILMIATGDGAELRVEGRGYARRARPEDRLWRVAGSLRFETADERYRWLNGRLAVWEGEFDADEERARYRAYLTSAA